MLCNRVLWIALSCLLLTTTVIGQPGQPPLSGPLVAFDTAAQDQIVLVETETGRERTLSFSSYSHRVWGFTPDGCRLLLTLSEGNNPAHVFTARLDGGDLRELVEIGADEGAWDPAFSPDGSQLVFTLSKPEAGFDATGGRSHRIALADITTGAVMTLSVSGDEHTPRWSPEGSAIAYTSYETDEVGGRTADLWLASADGSERTRLTDFPSGSVTMPRWSPDGELIGFIYSAEPNRDTVWMIGAAPGALPTQLSFAPALALDLTWLPSGIAMLAVLRDFRGELPNRIWQIPLVGTADYDAVLYPPTANFDYPDYPRFSDQGDKLALRTTYALTLLTLPDGQGAPVAGSEGNSPAFWSPAGFAGEAACSP
ncbi:MAG: hypothetical protein U0452_04555 [Anaerolineae bacterium]